MFIRIICRSWANILVYIDVPIFVVTVENILDTIGV